MLHQRCYSKHITLRNHHCMKLENKFVVCPLDGHMVGILPREWRWCTMWFSEFDNLGNNSYNKVLRDGILYSALRHINLAQLSFFRRYDYCIRKLIFFQHTLYIFLFSPVCVCWGLGFHIRSISFLPIPNALINCHCSFDHYLVFLILLSFHSVFVCFKCFYEECWINFE